MSSEPKAMESDNQGTVAEKGSISKSSRRTLLRAKKSKQNTESDKSDPNMFIPEVLVKVEIEELEETSSTGDFDKNTTSAAKLNTKNTRATRKRKIIEPDFNHLENKKKHLGCEECDKNFKTVQSLKNHMLSHTRRTKCPICGKFYKDKRYYLKHLSSHEKKEKCDQSKETIVIKEEMEYHNSSHEDINNVTDINLDELPNFSKMADGFLTREQLTYTVQNAIVSKMHKGRTVADICRLYYVTPSVVNEIWNDRDKFIVPPKVSKKTIKHMNSVLEPDVYTWFKAQEGKAITGRMIQTVAEKVARDNGFVHFNAGIKWLEQFKKKYNIYLNKSNRDYSQRKPESMFKSKFFEEQWSKIREVYNDEDIYALDEVGLFYNPSEGRVKKLGGKKYIQGTESDRFSIILCTNMTGTDKKKLVVSGTDDPLRYSQRDLNTLPVDYRTNPSCHITMDMFEDFATKWNKNLTKNNKKAILILDRAVIHSKMKFKNLKLEFLPWKAVNSLMPIKNGVFSGFRKEFRNLLLLFKVINVYRGVDRNLTCLEAIEIMAEAWKRIKPQTIVNSFIDLGYEVQKANIKDETENPIEDKLCEILKDYNIETYFTDAKELDMYVTVDEKLLTAQGTNYTVFAGNQNLIELKDESTMSLSTDKFYSKEKQAVIKKCSILKILETVRKFFETKQTDFETFCEFMKNDFRGFVNLEQIS